MEIKIEKIEVAKLELKPGDIVVLFTEMCMSVEGLKNLQNSAEVFFPGHKVVVLPEGIKLALLGGING